MDYIYISCSFIFPMIQSGNLGLSQASVEARTGTGTLLRPSISQGPRDSGKSRALQRHPPGWYPAWCFWWTPGHATIAYDTFSKGGYVWFCMIYSPENMSVIAFDRERPILNLDKQLKKWDESGDYGIIINYLIWYRNSMLFVHVSCFWMMRKLQCKRQTMDYNIILNRHGIIVQGEVCSKRKNDIVFASTSELVSCKTMEVKNLGISCTTELSMVLVW